MNVIDIVWQILDMNLQLKEQVIEIERLKVIEKEYNRLLNSSIRHNEVMMGNTIKLLLTPGVCDALVSNVDKTQFKE